MSPQVFSDVFRAVFRLFQKPFFQVSKLLTVSILWTVNASLVLAITAEASFLCSSKFRTVSCFWAWTQAHRIVNSAASHNPKFTWKTYTIRKEEIDSKLDLWRSVCREIWKKLDVSTLFPHWHSVSFCSDFYFFVVFVPDPFGSFQPPWLWPWQLWRHRALSAMHSAWSSAFPRPDIARPRDRFEDFEVSATSQNDGHLLMTAFCAPHIFSVHTMWFIVSFWKLFQMIEFLFTNVVHVLL